MKPILVINGPNLNMLGRREPDIYGDITLTCIEHDIAERAYELKVDVEFFQSNSESEIVDRIHKSINANSAIIINPAAFSHYSYAVLDALKCVSLPTVEVHLSHIYSREEFRHHSVVAAACLAQISGMGAKGYLYALDWLTHRFREGIAGV